jgi:hypothetical protein
MAVETEGSILLIPKTTILLNLNQFHPPHNLSPCYIPTSLSSSEVLSQNFVYIYPLPSHHSCLVCCILYFTIQMIEKLQSAHSNES